MYAADEKEVEEDRGEDTKRTSSKDRLRWSQQIRRRRSKKDRSPELNERPESAKIVEPFEPNRAPADGASKKQNYDDFYFTTT